MTFLPGKSSSFFFYMPYICMYSCAISVACFVNLTRFSNLPKFFPVLNIHPYTGSHSTMLGVINLFVHTVMYSYYFITSLKPIEGTLWWKRHITQLQLLQFGCLTLHFLQVLIHNTCNHPFIISFMGFVQNIFMFLLFFDFYYKAYVKKRPQLQNKEK